MVYSCVVNKHVQCIVLLGEGGSASAHRLKIGQIMAVPSPLCFLSCSRSMPSQQHLLLQASDAITMVAFADAIAVRADRPMPLYHPCQHNTTRHVLTQILLHGFSPLSCRYTCPWLPSLEKISNNRHALSIEDRGHGCRLCCFR